LIFYNPEHGAGLADAATHPLGENPIAGDKPAGDNARYDPEFEQLQAEVGKMENPAGGEIKWQTVVDLSRNILQNKSKDLLVGSYLAYGLLQQQGYQGLLEGLGVLNSMCAAHWDGGMFPDRPRARESALDWLIDKVQPQLDNGTPADAAELPILQSATATVEALGAFVNGKLEVPNPKLNALARSFAAKSAQSAGAATGQPAAATQGGGAPVAASGGGGSGPITNRKVAFERLKEVADFLRRTEPHSPVSYLVNRAVKWGDMPLETVLSELVKNKDVRLQILETLGLKDE
jgi:type VI secretion system protein VasJ